jgi:hypothetical protein
MNHEIYIFGSICRGELCPTSDVDVLVLPFAKDRSNFPISWSIYSPELLREYFSQGRLFAWHLHLEAKCVFSLHQTPYLTALGTPAPYSTMNRDIDELEELLHEAIYELANGTNSVVYELGIAYTAIRDIAMSASWSLLGAPCFSSDAPFRLPNPCPIEFTTYKQAKLARHSSTRGTEIETDLGQVVSEIIRAPFEQWIDSLRGEK